MNWNKYIIDFFRSSPHVNLLEGFQNEFSLTETQHFALHFPEPFHDDRLWFKLPSQPLVEAYEAKKKDYMETKFKEFEEKLTGRSRDSSDGIPLTCGECGYSWQYHGFLRMATCPNCNSKVYILEKETTFNGFDVKCNHCSYIWIFTGSSKRTTSPNCEQKVDTERNRVPDSDDSNLTV